MVVSGPPWNDASQTGAVGMSGWMIFWGEGLSCAL